MSPIAARKSVLVFYAEVIFCQYALEFVAGLGDIFFGPLFAVYYADNIFNSCTGLGDNLCRFEDLAAGGGDVLNEQDNVVCLQDALNHFAGSVALFAVANDDPVFAGFHSGGRSQGHAA